MAVGNSLEKRSIALLGVLGESCKVKEIVFCCMENAGSTTHPTEVTAEAWWCPDALIMHTQLPLFASPGDFSPWLCPIMASTVFTWPKLI